jgi:hypothetical protein
MRHKELNGTAFGIADETAVCVAVSRLGDARRSHDEVAVCPIVVEWAQAREVHARLAERHEVAHDILNLRAVNDSLYYFVWYLWHRSNVRVYLAASLYYTKPLRFAILNRFALLY